MNYHKFEIGEYWVSKLDTSVFHICLTKDIFLIDDEFYDNIQYSNGLHVNLTHDWDIIA